MTTEIEIDKASPPASTPSNFASQASFSQKIVNFAITMDSAPSNAQPTTFAESQGSTSPGTYNISGKRARVRISNATAPAGNQADITIYGLSQSLMNQLATLGVVFDSVSKNQILVSAGASSGTDASSAAADAVPVGAFPVVFGGTIWFAYGDYQQMPDVPFRIVAQGGLIDAVQSVAPTSYNGSASVATLMETFANQLGVTFENNGVTGVLQNPYYPGTVLQQVYRCAEHANIYAQLVDGGTKLAIWPRTGFRTSQSVPLISPDTGMIGYPSFAQNGWLVVKMIYNPDVVFGGNIQVDSSIPQANKAWTVFKLDLALDTLLPGGDWMATAMCRPPNAPSAVPPVSG